LFRSKGPENDRQSLSRTELTKQISDPSKKKKKKKKKN
jgi:hypothetical protein